MQFNEKQQKFCTEYVNGTIPLEICRQEGISEQTFNEWMETPEFLAAFRQAREQLRFKLVQAVTHEAFNGDARAVEFLLKYHGFIFSEKGCYPNGDFGRIEISKDDHCTHFKEGFIPSI